MKKVIVAQVNIKDEFIAEFKEKAAIIVANTNKEDGNICYRLMQGVADANDFVFYEEYVDQAAIETHSASDYFKAFGEAIAPMITAPMIVDIYEKE